MAAAACHARQASTLRRDSMSARVVLSTPTVLQPAGRRVVAVAIEGSWARPTALLRIRGIAAPCAQWGPTLTSRLARKLSTGTRRLYTTEGFMISRQHVGVVRFSVPALLAAGLRPTAHVIQDTCVFRTGSRARTDWQRHFVHSASACAPLACDQLCVGKRSMVTGMCRRRFPLVLRNRWAT